MDSDLGVMFNTLQHFKNSIITTSDKIENYVLRAINDFSNSLEKKEKVSLVIVKILENYIKIALSNEVILRDLLKKLEELEQCEPVRDNNYDQSPILNPFSDPFILSQLCLQNQVATSENVSQDSDNLNQSHQSNSSDTLIQTLTATSENVSQDSDHLNQSRQSNSAETLKPNQMATSENVLQESGNLNSLDQSNSTEKLDFDLERLSRQSVTETEDKNFETQEVEVPEQLPAIKVEAVQESDVKFTPNIPEKPVRKSSSEVKYTALAKLKNMQVFDRKEVATRQFRKKVLPDNFALIELPKTNINEVAQQKRVRFEKKSRKVIYEPIELNLIEGTKCTVCHIVSPSEFYVQCYPEVFEKFHENLNEDFNSNTFFTMNRLKSKSEAMDSIGNFCFTFDPTRRFWYRAVIMDWIPHELDQVLLHLVDVGEKLICSYRYLQNMTEDYSKVPKMSTRCHFYNLIATLDTPTNWTQRCINGLVKLTEKPRKFVIIFANREGSSYGVDLTEENAEISLGQMMVERGLACEEISLERSSLDIPDEELVEPDNINEAITGYDAKDEARVCAFSDSTGRCFKGPKCKLEHVILPADGITTDKVLTCDKALAKLYLPPIGTEISILITAYRSTCHFYAHIIRNKSKSSPYNQEFEDLNNAMNSNNIVHLYEPFKVLPAVGEIVLVKHIGEWYRGRCIGPGDLPDVLEIYLVDYGLPIMKKWTELRHIKDEFLHTPFQAVECMLAAYSDKSNADQAAAQKFFLNCMNFKVFVAVVRSLTEPLKLDVFDDKGLDIGWVMSNYYGFCEKDDNDLSPSKSCILQLAD